MIVSALLVALIVVATFNGFDVVNRAQAEDRAHDQAVILAAESQEQLRTDPVTTLQALESAPHTYTQLVNGTSYQITQEAAPSNGSANTTGCSAIETTKQTGANVEITSKVSWAGLAVAKRPEVKLSSIITPPTGAGLEVDVGNNPAPTEGVSGVTAVLTFTPVNSTTPETREGTTNSAGCVVFGDIEATSATVEIAEKSGFVTTSGTFKVPPKEVTLAPNITVHDAVTYDQGGAIKANFTWKGESATGDSFVVANGSLPPEPQFQVGANLFSYEGTGEEHYQAETGKYASSATTAKGNRYSTGDLFPFLEPNRWAVYSGDCPANDPHSFNAAIKDAEALVKPGATTEANNVAISKTSLLVREGTKSSSSAAPSGLQVKITNTACSSSLTPNNASKLNFTHEQKTTGEGSLEFPFQPFGAYELCVANKTAKKRYKYLGSNTTEAGTAPTVYLGARSSTEKAETKTKKENEEKSTKTARESAEATAKSKRESEEATAKAKRETEEKPAKTTWETETTNEANKKAAEANTKTTRETNEANERTKWKYEEECYNAGNAFLKALSPACTKSSKKEMSPATRIAEEAKQTTSRNTLIAAEKVLETARIAEEAVTKANRTAQEATQHAKETEESNGKTAKETEEATARAKKEGEEKAVETARKKEETEETEEATTTKVTVESGTAAEKC